jgi:TPR repeat protein
MEEVYGDLYPIARLLYEATTLPRRGIGSGRPFYSAGVMDRAELARLRAAETEVVCFTVSRRFRAEQFRDGAVFKGVGGDSVMVKRVGAAVRERSPGCDVFDMGEAVAVASLRVLTDSGEDTAAGRVGAVGAGRRGDVVNGSKTEGDRRGLAAGLVEVVYELESRWLHRLVRRTGRGFLASSAEGVLGPFESVWVREVSVLGGRPLIRLCDGSVGAPSSDARGDAGKGARLFGRARALMFGEGVGGDPGCAMRRFRKAAARGHIEAVAFLGRQLTNGEGDRAGTVEGVEWLRKAAELGHAGAMTSYGWALLQGIGGEKDEACAFDWFMKASKGGVADAQCEVGWMLLRGIGVSHDGRCGTRWLRKAPERGSAKAMVLLGLELDKERMGQGFGWFRRAAELGERTGMMSVGHALAQGIGVGKDTVAAMSWFAKAAERGCSDAMCELGVALTLGEDVAGDRLAGFNWLRKSAEAGTVKAMMALWRGFGGMGESPEFREIATAWLRRAAELGNRDARRELRSMEGAT